MLPPIFFAPPENRQDDIIRLPNAEAHHARKVMRLRQGTLVVVIDALGLACRGELVWQRGEAIVRILSEIRNFGEPSVRLTLAAGLSAGHKFDSTVQKATELGVKRLIPIVCERSKVKLDDPRKSKARVKRLERVALASIKQCRRSYRPDINAPRSLSEFLSEISRDDLNLIFITRPGASDLKSTLFEAQPSRAVVLVGPEAGFTDDETDLATAAGCLPISLGSRILRTETAGPAVCALVMYELGELR